jgi:di/tricarboxylate transporter
MAEASASPAAPRPLAGIVTACVLGGVTLAWTLLPREPAATEWGPDVQNVSNGVHLLGCTALLIGALLSLAGQRVGNRIVRGTSWLMIVAVLGLMLMTWRLASMGAEAELGENAAAVLGGVALVTALFGIAQWVLYLYLFRRSRYP